MKALDLKIIARVDRPIGNLEGLLEPPFKHLQSEESLQILVTPFDALAKDQVLIRHLEAYVNYYIWRYLNIEILQQESAELRRRTEFALED